MYFYWHLLLCTFLSRNLVIGSVCGDGYFSNENSECVACPDHCLFCDSSEHCLSCANGFWGNVCELPCSNCMTGTSCEKTNGFCHDKCITGNTGILCDAKCDMKCLSCNRTHADICVECNLGKYPPSSCNKTCSGCSGTNCDETGACIFGCVNVFWGRTCENKCSNHCQDDFCDTDNGTCLLGCKLGFLGPVCNETKSLDRNGTVVISVAVTVTVIVIVFVVAIFVRRTRCFSYCPRKKKQDNIQSAEETVLVDQPTDVASKTKLSKELTFHEDKANATKSKSSAKNIKIFGKAQTVDHRKKTGEEKLKKIVDRIKKLKDEDFRNEFVRLPFSMNTDQTPVEAEPGEVSDKGKVGVVVSLNACFLKAKECETPLYIACKAPSEEVVIFWDMLWQLDCKTIVMLSAKEGLEAQRYWPIKDKPVKYGSLFIKCVEENSDVQRHINTRLFQINKGLDAKTVTQLQYTDWPERGFTENIQHLVEFRREVDLQIAKQNKSRSLVVHGRAGVGRTGTFIAIDMLLKEADEMVRSGVDKNLDVFACVKNLRQRGKNMVENVEQYKFLYQVLLCYIEEQLRDKNGKENEASKVKVVGNTQNNETETLV